MEGNCDRKLQRAAVSVENADLGSDCLYDVICNYGDVVCEVVLMAAISSENFSICEISVQNSVTQST